MKLEDSVQGSRRRRSSKIHGPGETKTQDACAVGAGARLRCFDFGWSSSWSVTGNSSHNGKATAAYLMEHPEEAGSIHVVM